MSLFKILEKVFILLLITVKMLSLKCISSHIYFDSQSKTCFRLISVVHVCVVGVTLRVYSAYKGIHPPGCFILFAFTNQSKRTKKCISN